MLTSLFPNTHTRYTSLPVLGAFLEDLCSWLKAHGYPPNAISRRMEAAPFLEKCLQEQQITLLSGCTAERLRACLPRQRRWTPQIAYALGRSLLIYLQERRALVSEPPNASEQLIYAYREHLAHVRGFAASTIARHAVVAATTFCAFSSATMTSSTCRRFRLVIWRRSSSKPALAWVASLCRRSSPSCDPF